ncbi:MAG: sulfatase-like hydrolase/transferase, partial [Planctomycetes bacterium]|nr:sulfatase-like hydrolase/transferase [Planctomycetota bacterium]
FISDNGGHEASPSLPLKGKKGTYWEGGLRVPFCARWDGVIPAGQKLSDPVISLDIMPTFIKAAGGKVDQAWKLDGVDLIPYMTGKNKDAPHDTLYWAWNGGRRLAIREGKYKAITNNGGSKFYLYNLREDISEKTDLSTSKPETLKELTRKLSKWELSLMRSQWGWNKKLGYKVPGFGKPEPYHDPDYVIE